MRHAARTDANQAEIVAALRQIGCRVWLIQWPADILVDCRGIWHLVEIKVPGGRLTKDQLELVTVSQAPVHIVESPEQAVAAVLGRKAMA